MRTENHIDHTIYPAHPYSPSVVGTFEEFVEAGGKKRKYLMYVPSDVRAACAGIFILPRNGKKNSSFIFWKRRIHGILQIPGKSLSMYMQSILLPDSGIRSLSMNPKSILPDLGTEARSHSSLPWISRRFMRVLCLWRHQIRLRKLWKQSAASPVWI